MKNKFTMQRFYFLLLALPQMLALTAAKANDPPVFTSCPADMTVFADASCQGTATWDEPIVSDDASTIIPTTTAFPGSQFPLGANVVIYTATDAEGASAICSFTVTVIDVTSPTLECPSNMTIATCGAINGIDPMYYVDNCSGFPAIVLTHTISGASTGFSVGSASGTVFNNGVSLVTYTATDAAGNTASCSFVLTVLQDSVTADISGDHHLCSGESTTLTASGGVFYLWNTSETSASIVVSPPATTTYTVIVTNVNGCTASASVTVEVHPMPAFTSGIPNQILCAGSPTDYISFFGSPEDVAFTWTNDHPEIGLEANGKGEIPSFVAINHTNAPIIAHVTVTPITGGFAYVPNTNTNHVSVINTATNTVVDNIPVGAFPIGVSLSPDESHVYIANTYDNTISAIETATNTVVATIPVGEYPHCLRVSPDGSTVYVANEVSNTITVIGTASYSVVATIPVSVSPVSFIFSPDGSLVYVMNRYDDSYSVINTATYTVELTVPAIGDYPFEACLTPDGKWLYTSNVLSDNVSVINTTTHTLVTTIGGLSHPGGICMSPDGKKIYVSNYFNESVSVINTTSNTIEGTIIVGTNPFGISISPDGERVYVANNGSNDVSVILTATNTVLSNVPVGSMPRSIGNFVQQSSCTGTPITFTITVNPKPDIFNVTGGDTICQSSLATVPIGLSGSQAPGYSYSLYRNGTDLVETKSGTGNALNFTPQNVPGAYTVIASLDGASCDTIMNDTAFIALYPLPNVFHVTGNGSICFGGPNASIGLDGSELGVRYQVYKGNVPIGNPVNGTGGALQMGSLTIAGTYRIKATIIATGCAIWMNGKLVVIKYPAIPLFTVTGGGAYCAGGLGVPVGLNGSTLGFLYQLYLNGVPVGLPVTGTNGPISFGFQTQAGSYTVIATNPASGCTRHMNGSRTITINPLPTLFNVTGGGGICAGSAGLPIGLSGSQTNVSYQLLLNGVSVGVPRNGTGAPFTFGAFTSPGTYTVMAMNAATGCMATMNGAAIISQFPLPLAFTVSCIGSTCSNSGGVPITLNGSELGVSYQLYLNGVPVGPPLIGTGMTLLFPNQTQAGNYTVIATRPATGCSRQMNGVGTLTILPAPTIQNMTGGGSMCAGGAGFPVGLSGSQVGVKYQLLLDGVITGAPKNGTGAALSFGIRNLAGIYTVIATRNNNGCSAEMYGSAVIVIYPLPVKKTMSGGGSYCAGDDGVSIYLNGSETGVSYQLELAGSPVGMPLAGTGNALVFEHVTMPGVYKIRATSAGGCNLLMFGSATVTVNPKPTAIASSNSPVIEGSTLNLFETAGSGNAWYWMGPNGFLSSLHNPSIDEVPLEASGTYTVIVSNSFGCTDTASTTVVIYHLLVFSGGNEDLAATYIKEGSDASANNVALHQNRPNPFSDQTEIGFYLPSELPATITIWETTGKLLFRTQAVFSAGENSMLLDASDLGASGVLICQLETPLGIETKLMLRIE